MRTGGCIYIAQRRKYREEEQQEYATKKIENTRGRSLKG